MIAEAAPARGSHLDRLCAWGVALSMVVPEGYSIAPLILMAAGAWAFLTGKWSRRCTNSAIVTLLVCFGVYAAGSAVISVVHGDHPGHFEQYLPFAAAALMAVALQTNATNPNVFVGGFAAAAVLGGIVSIFQVVLAEGVHRASLFNTTNTFGMLGALYGLVCASALGWTRNEACRKWRILLVAGALGGLTISLLSGSKGSWLPLLLVGPVAFAQATRSLRLLDRMKWAAAIAAYCFAISALPHSPIISRVEGFSHHGDSFRVSYWKAGLAMIKTNPLLGIGREEVSRQLVELTTRQRGAPLPPDVTRDLHNEYLDILAARGIVGFALAVMALGVPFVLLVRLARSAEGLRREIAVTGVLFIVAFAIAGLTDAQFLINAKRMTYVLSVVVFVHFASSASGRNP